VEARPPGQVVILNGTPRSGKSSIAAVIQETFDGPWMSLGADTAILAMTPPRYRPGIGLRPGGERPDLEEFVVRACAALFDSIAAHSRQGLNVVVDLGLHDGYSEPRGIAADGARRLAGLPVLFVGVRCPVGAIMQRRDAGQPGGERAYARSGPGGEIPGPVLRWQEAVHRLGPYDLEVDTSLLTAEECAAAIRSRLDAGPPGAAFHALAAR